MAKVLTADAPSLSEDEASKTLTISARRWAAGLVALAIIIALLSLLRDTIIPAGGGDGVAGFIERIDLKGLLAMGQPGNLPTWYATALWLVNAGLLALLARRTESRYWMGLTALALLLAAEQITGLHHRFVALLPGDSVALWLIPALALIAGFAWLYRGWFAQLPASIRPLMLASGALLIVSGIVFGVIVDMNPTSLAATAQGFAQFIGVILLMYALLNLIADEPPITIRLERPLRLALILGGIALVFTLATVVLYTLDRNTTVLTTFDPHRFFYLLDTNQEETIPTVYSVGLFLCAGGLLAAISAGRRRDQARFALYWGGLALVFVLLSLDDAASLHERTMQPARALVYSKLAIDDNGFLEFAWVIFGMAFVLALTVIYLRFFFHLPRRTKLLFILAAGLFIVGTISLEMINGYFVRRYGNETTIKLVLEVLEEGVENIGLVVFIYALFDYFRTNVQPLTVRVRANGDVS